MFSPTPHRFGYPVWDLRDLIGWVLDRDPAKFGRIHNTEDAKAAVHVALFYKTQERTERDPNALTTILHALQSGRLAAHEGEAVLPREHWGTKTEIDLRSAISRGLWFFSEHALMLWPAEGALPEAAVPKAPIRIGNDPEREPDWTIWRHIPKLRVFEAVALSLNIDPHKVRHHPQSWMADKRLFQESQEFKNRIFVLESNLEEIGIINARAYYYMDEAPLIRTDRFIAWANRIGWALPPEMLSGIVLDQRREPSAIGRENDHRPAAPNTEERVRPVPIPKKVEVAKSWLSEAYPEGIPAGTSAKELARQLEADKKVRVHERTMRRALGRA